MKAQKVNGTWQSAAKPLASGEGSTASPQGRRDKRPEVRSPERSGEDMVYSGVKAPAARKGDAGSKRIPREYVDENMRYVEQTNIAKGNGSTGISTANGGDMVAWTQSKSDWIFFFGNDTVAEAVATPEEMRGKIPTDYGRSKGVAYYYLGGFGIVQNSTSAPGNCRIFKWASAA